MVSILSLRFLELEHREGCRGAEHDAERDYNTDSTIKSGLGYKSPQNVTCQLHRRKKFKDKYPDSLNMLKL